MTTMQELADELTVANAMVVLGRRNIGRTNAVKAIEVKITGRTRDGVSLNSVVLPNYGTAFIDRTARIWLNQVGPVAHQMNAEIWIGAATEADVTDLQRDAVDVLVSVLTPVYGLSAPEPEPEVKKPARKRRAPSPEES